MVVPVSLISTLLCERLNEDIFAKLKIVPMTHIFGTARPEQAHASTTGGGTLLSSMVIPTEA